MPELSESELKNVSGGVDLAAVAISMYDGYEGRA
ncbi:class IIb bacteriocin, lactobin A/cerein 7B family [Synechococcus sp. UW179A]